MSYARFGPESDVYVYASVAGHVECCGCLIGDQWDFYSPEDVVTHLSEHVTAGHKVDPGLLDASMYPPGDFVAMCMTFLCRENAGHEGEHTPITSPNQERDQAIRDRIESGWKQ